MGEQYIDVDPSELRVKASALDSTTATLSVLSTSVGLRGLHPTGPVVAESAPSAVLLNALASFERAWPAALKAMAVHTTAIAAAMRGAADGYTSADLLPPLLPAGSR